MQNHQCTCCLTTLHPLHTGNKCWKCENKSARTTKTIHIYCRDCRRELFKGNERIQQQCHNCLKKEITHEK